MGNFIGILFVLYQGLPTDTLNKRPQRESHYRDTASGGGSPVAVVLVVFVGVDHGAGLHTDLLEQVPHFLVDVLL